MLLFVSPPMLSRQYKVLDSTLMPLQYFVLEFGWNLNEGFTTFMLTSHIQLYLLQFSESDQVSGECSWLQDY